MPHILLTRAATALATVLLTTTATAAAIATPAAAADSTGPLINTSSGRCMTASSSGTVTMTSTCPDQPSHRWTLVYDEPTNTRALRHEGTGWCLSEVSVGLVRLDDICDHRDWRQNWHPRLSPYSITFRTDDSARHLAEQSGAVLTTTGGSGTTWRMWR